MHRGNNRQSRRERQNWVNRKITLFEHGHEEQPLLCIDEFLPNPNALRTVAAQRDFVPIGPHYPGIRYPLPEEGVMPMLAGLTNHLINIFELSRQPKFLEAYLSIVTKVPSQLSLIQRLPHFDGVESERLAVLVYLSPRHNEGTSFFRHRSTQYESITGDRFGYFQSQLQSDLAREGEPAPEYIKGDTAIYEHIAHYEGIFNRAIIYRGNTLHCADLDADFVPTSDPENGRLTLNLFMN
jgi:hypothetical protein